MTNETSAVTAAELDALERRLWDSDAASALTNQAARSLASLRKQLAEAQEREAQLVAALREARGDILHAVNARGSEYEGTDEDAVGYIDAVLSASPSPVLRDAVIEECAKVAEKAFSNRSNEIAWAIRALASRPVSERKGVADTAPAPAISGGESEELVFDGPWTDYCEENMVAGCCSAISPCAHQRGDPFSICDVCKRAALAAADRSAAAPAPVLCVCGKPREKHSAGEGRCPDPKGGWLFARRYTPAAAPAPQQGDDAP